MVSAGAVVRCHWCCLLLSRQRQQQLLWFPLLPPLQLQLQLPHSRHALQQQLRRRRCLHAFLLLLLLCCLQILQHPR